MTLLLFMTFVNMVAILSVVLNFKLWNLLKRRDETIDELRYAIDTDSIAIVGAADEAKYYKRQYERQLGISSKLMERIKLHEY